MFQSFSNIDSGFCFHCNGTPESVVDYLDQIASLATDVTMLDLSSNNLSELPQSISQFENVEVLKLTNNQFSLFSGFEFLPKRIQELDISMSFDSISGLNLTKYRDLTILNIAGCGVVPNWMMSDLSIKKLYVDYVQFYEILENAESESIDLIPVCLVKSGHHTPEYNGFRKEHEGTDLIRIKDALERKRDYMIHNADKIQIQSADEMSAAKRLLYNQTVDLNLRKKILNNIDLINSIIDDG